MPQKLPERPAEASPEPKVGGSKMLQRQLDPQMAKVKPKPPPPPPPTPPCAQNRECEEVRIRSESD